MIRWILVQIPLGAIFDEIYFVLFNFRSVTKSDKKAYREKPESYVITKNTIEWAEFSVELKWTIWKQFTLIQNENVTILKLSLWFISPTLAFNLLVNIKEFYHTGQFEMMDRVILILLDLYIEFTASRKAKIAQNIPGICWLLTNNSML